jgi:hypothetical protein
VGGVQLTASQTRITLQLTGIEEYMSQIKVTCDKHGIDSLLGFRSYANTREAELKAACRSLQDALSASQDQNQALTLDVASLQDRLVHCRNCEWLSCLSTTLLQSACDDTRPKLN